MNLFEALIKTYPDVDLKVMNSAVNAFRCRLSGEYNIDERSTIDDLVYLLSKFTDNELLSIRNMGKNKIEFLRRVQHDHLPEQMSAREKIKRDQHARYVTDDKNCALECGMSEVLFKMVKNGEVTHPNIARRIQKVFGLTDLEAEELMPENRRPHSPKYEPDKFVVKDQKVQLNLVKPNYSATEKEYREYILNANYETKARHGVAFTR